MHVCRAGVKLKRFLDDYKHEAALVVHWVLVGPSNQETRPAAGGVLRTYRHCEKHASAMIKSITNTYKLANTASNPHSFEYRCAANSTQSVRCGRCPHQGMQGKIVYLLCLAFSRLRATIRITELEQKKKTIRTMFETLEVA